MAYTLEDEFGDIIGKARRGNGLSVGEVAAGAGHHRSATVPDGRLHAETDGGPSPQNRGGPPSQRHPVGGHCDGTLGARTGPIGIRRRSGGRHHHSGCRWMARPCVPLSVQSDQRGCHHRHGCAPRRCAAKGGGDRR